MAESAEHAGIGVGLTLTIDLGALAANWSALARRAAPAECAAAVKADAYGIGIAQAVPALWNAGCRTFFVALPQEGVRVREVAPGATIYVLNGDIRSAARLYGDHGLRPVLNTADDMEDWITLGGGASAIHVDTGMQRLGLSASEAADLARKPDQLAAASTILLMSHLACADDPASPMNAEQLRRMRDLAGRLPRLPVSIANSAGIFLGSEYLCDLVRPGIALYGGWRPDAPTSLSTVATLKARIVQVRNAAAGESVGYGAAQRLKRDSKLATLSVGYADGYPRSAGSDDSRPSAYVLIRGEPAPVVGRISMDLTVVDVTGIPDVVAGDWAELFGANLPIEDVARAAGTISYELLTGLSRRAQRVYLNAPGGT